MQNRRDWFSFLTTREVISLRAEMEAGPQDLDELSPGVWGIKGIGAVCAGDAAQMRKVQAKRFHEKFHTIAPGNYQKQAPASPTVADRIKSTMVYLEVWA